MLYIYCNDDATLLRAINFLLDENKVCTVVNLTPKCKVVSCETDSYLLVGKAKANSFAIKSDF